MMLATCSRPIRLLQAKQKAGEEGDGVKRAACPQRFRPRAECYQPGCSNTPVGRRRAFLAMTSSLAALQLAPLASAAATNTAVLESIQRLKADQTLEKQELAGRDRLLGAKQQLVQIERLALSGDYQNARLQLRKGAMSSVRLDVREAEKEFGGLTKETGDSLVQAIEQLDQGLRAQPAREELRQLISAVSEASDRVQRELILPN